MTVPRSCLHPLTGHQRGWGGGPKALIRHDSAGSPQLQSALWGLGVLVGLLKSTAQPLLCPVLLPSHSVDPESKFSLLSAPDAISALFPRVLGPIRVLNIGWYIIWEF